MAEYDDESYGYAVVDALHAAGDALATIARLGERIRGEFDGPAHRREAARRAALAAATAHDDPRWFRLQPLLDAGHGPALRDALAHRIDDLAHELAVARELAERLDASQTPPATAGESNDAPRT